MATNTATNKWKNQLREIVKEHWDKFTNEDLNKIEGMRDELVDLVQARYGYAQQRAEDEVNQFLTAADTKKQAFMGNLTAKKDEVSQKLDQNLDHYNRRIEDTVGSLPGGMDQTLLKYPWVSLVMAVGIGLILGILLKPRS